MSNIVVKYQTLYYYRVRVLLFYYGTELTFKIVTCYIFRGIAVKAPRIQYAVRDSQVKECDSRLKKMGWGNVRTKKAQQILRIFAKKSTFLYNRKSFLLREFIFFLCKKAIH